MSLGVVGKAYAEYAEDIRQIFCCFNLEKPEQTGGKTGADRDNAPEVAGTPLMRQNQ